MPKLCFALKDTINLKKIPQSVSSELSSQSCSLSQTQWFGMHRLLSAHWNSFDSHVLLAPVHKSNQDDILSTSSGFVLSSTSFCSSYYQLGYEKRHKKRRDIRWMVWLSSEISRASEVWWFMVLHNLGTIQLNQVRESQWSSIQFVPIEPVFTRRSTYYGFGVVWH